MAATANTETLNLDRATIQRLLSGKYSNRDECVSLAHALTDHAYGRVPERLIFERRPNESEEIKAYRTKIYVPVTRQTISKVCNSLEKIRRSQDWAIQYDANAVKKSIKEDETLEHYCEIAYPGFSSLTNWAFSVLLRKYLLDANGFIAIIPQTAETRPNEYIKPVAEFFDSDQVVDFSEGQYIVLKSRDTTTYRDVNGTTVKTNGAIYHILTDTQYYRYEQVSDGKEGSTFEERTAYTHNIGELPAFKAGGLFHRRVNNDTIYESRIAGMVPSLDEAAREYSDLQAEILQHIHSEKWAFSNIDCPTCHGIGKITQTDETGEETLVECPTCHGRGSVTNTSPYGMYTISPSRFGENALPTPPMGYVQKDTAIATFVDTHVKQHLRDALAAVNMEFLAEGPISQSGLAKAYDRDELNNFVNGIAEDLVRILDNCYRFINEYRYRIIVPDDKQRKAMLPQINVPSKYDILNTSALMEELKAAKEAKVSPLIIRELEVDYANKQFNTNPDVAHAIEASFDLDPLFGKTEDEKMAMLSNHGVTETNYIISCNIAAFIQRAIKEQPDFLKLDYKSQQAKLQTYAEEVRKANQPTENPLLSKLINPTETED